MFDWLKKKAAAKQESNIQDTLAKLIHAADEAHGTIQRLGDAFPQQKQAIHQLQNQLMFDLIGPIPLDEIKQRIFEPSLHRPGITEGARMAVDHVYDSAVRARQGSR
jgi:hypothetical protein